MESDNQGTLLTYLRYAVIGGIVGVFAVIARELIGAALPADTPEYYALSVAIVYAVGILASYAGHRRFTFRHVDMTNRTTARSLSAFTFIALFGLACTTGLSVVIRYMFPAVEYLGDFSAPFSFALATVITSVITFSLNAKYSYFGRSRNLSRDLSGTRKQND